MTASIVLRRILVFSLFLISLQPERGWAQVPSDVDFYANGTVYKLPVTGGWAFSLSRGDQRARVHLDAGAKGRLSKLAYLRGLISEGYRLDEADIWVRDACESGMFTAELCLYSVLSFRKKAVVELISIKKYDDFRVNYEKSSGWVRRSLKNNYNINLKKTHFPNESPLSGVYFLYTLNDNLEIQVRVRIDDGRDIVGKIENLVDDNVVLFCEKLIRGVL